MSEKMLDVLLNALAKLTLDYNRERFEMCVKIFDKYMRIFEHAIGELTPITSLDLGRKYISPDQIQDWKEKISKLYFSNYIYLPPEVLNELNCLHACLQSGGKKLYKVVNKHKIVKCTNKDVVNFIGEVVIIESKKTQLERMLNVYGIDNFPISFKINFQVRRAIGIIDKNFADFKISSWHAILKKETLNMVATCRN